MNVLAWVIKDPRVYGSRRDRNRVSGRDEHSRRLGESKLKVNGGWLINSRGRCDFQPRLRWDRFKEDDCKGKDRGVTVINRSFRNWQH